MQKYIHFRDACRKLAKAHKIQNANSYICIGGRPKTHEAGGIAGKGTVCDKDVTGRTTFVQQVTMSGQTGELLSTAASKVVTSEVNQTSQTSFYKLPDARGWPKNSKGNKFQSFLCSSVFTLFLNFGFGRSLPTRSDTSLVWVTTLLGWTQLS